MAGFSLDALALVPRILLLTDGTLTHILEAYAAEPVHLVKLAHALVSGPSLPVAAGLEPGERVLRRTILLRGTKSDATFIHAESWVFLDRLPPPVKEGLLETDTPIGKLLFSCRAETYREMIEMGEARDPEVASHFGPGDGDLLFRTYQLVFAGRPVATITERFPKDFLGPAS